MKNFSAVVFPGQGSQQRGMGSDFAGSFLESRQVFNQASKVLGFDVLEICEKEDSELHLTEYTQPCLLTCGIAMYEGLREHYGLNPKVFGGHSLGEITALVAAGAIPFEIGLRLARSRGKLMQASMSGVQGGMAAIIQLEPSWSEITKIASHWEVDVANFNSPKQITLSGEISKLRACCADIAKNAKPDSIKIVFLNVSAAFHSRHMRETQELFRKIVNGLSHSFRPDRAKKVVSNVSGVFHTGSLAPLVDALVSQFSQPVLWQENMRALHEKSANILEIGPSAVLSGFFKSIGVDVPTVTGLRTLARIANRPKGKEIACESLANINGR